MDGGRLASLAAVLAVAGVAAASLADSRSSGGAPRAAATTQPATTPPPADTVPAVGTLTDQLERLPAVAPGELRGRIHRRLPACQWRSTDLATGADDDVTPPGRCPLWVPGWRYAFQFAVEQSANAPIIRGIVVRAGTREVGRIRVPEEVTGGAAGTPGGRLALCLHGSRDETRVYTGARLDRIVPACDPVAFGEEFLFQDGGRFRDDDGRVVLDLGRPPVFVHPVASGLVVAVTGDGLLRVYRGRRLLHERALPDGLRETDVLDADADRDGVHRGAAHPPRRAERPGGGADARRRRAGVARRLGAVGLDGAGRAVGGVRGGRRARDPRRRHADPAGAAAAGAGRLAPGLDVVGGRSGWRSCVRAHADNPGGVRPLSS